MVVPSEIITKAAELLISQLGANGVRKVGGCKWWQWRRNHAELRAEWIEMRGDYRERQRKGGMGRRVMLYVHGGAYFFGSVDEHRYQMQRHARKLRARVFAPRYRLAPQYPFPCGLHDCLAAYLYLLIVQEPEEIILAGDSAGGGMVVSILVTLRDQGLPLPAGAVLISPWADLTHSFPSVAGDSELDYIPARGFMQKPSASWPPPDDDEIGQLSRGQSAAEDQQSCQAEAGKGSAVRRLIGMETNTMPDLSLAPVLDEDCQPANTIAGHGHHLSIELEGKLVILKDQIQLYTTNQLLSHPLVSPVLQPSLGGLPPLLILTGGGEILRDEQIYLAHKVANPSKYPLSSIHQAEHDPNNAIVDRYPPTDVQLQVWDDLCHVAPTLSFTRPAKFMYRSIAQFSAWALARAQRRSIEITDDDDVSVISSGSEGSSSVLSSELDELDAQNAEGVSHVGRAGDPLPMFKNHMIRQRVDRHGVIYDMAPESDIPALQMPASDVGVIKPGPLGKWLAAKKAWDTRYAPEKRKVQKRRIQEMKQGGFELFGDDERPPPSALVGRRKKDRGANEAERKKKKSWGMMLWSLWGSKHDESTIRREEEMIQEEEEDAKSKMATTNGAPLNGDGIPKDPKTQAERPRATSIGSRSRARRKSNVKSIRSDADNDPSEHRPRRRTVTVSDQGQTEGGLDELRRNNDMEMKNKTEIVRDGVESDGVFLSPTYSPRQEKPGRLSKA